MCPSSGSVSRHLPFLHRVQRVLRSPASAVLRRCSDFLPLVLRASFPSRRKYHEAARFVRERGVAVCRLLVGVAPVPRSSPFDPDSRERQDLPSSRENPNVRAPCSPTPAGSLRQAITTLGCCRPHSQTDRLPRLNPPFEAQSHGSRHSLSTLRGSDYSDRHHARLASGWRPAFAGQGFDLLGSR